MPLEHWQVRGNNHLSLKLVAMFDHPHSNEIFLHVQPEHRFYIE